MKPFLAVSVWLASVIWLAINIYNLDPMAITALIISSILSFLLFKDTVNSVQAVGPIYWICRDVIPTGTPRVSWGFMRQLSSPWRVGKGVQIRLKRHTFQIGLSRKSKKVSDENGLLYAIQGRYLGDTPKDIRDWK